MLGIFTVFSLVKRIVYGMLVFSISCYRKNGMRMALEALEGSTRYCVRKAKPRIVKTPQGRKNAWLTRRIPPPLKRRIITNKSAHINESPLHTERGAFCLRPNTGV